MLKSKGRHILAMREGKGTPMRGELLPRKKNKMKRVVFQRPWERYVEKLVVAKILEYQNILEGADDAANDTDESSGAGVGKQGGGYGQGHDETWSILKSRQKRLEKWKRRVAWEWIIGENPIKPRIRLERTPTGPISEGAENEGKRLKKGKGKGKAKVGDKAAAPKVGDIQRKQKDKHSREEIDRKAAIKIAKEILVWIKGDNPVKPRKTSGGNRVWTWIIGDTPIEPKRKSANKLLSTKRRNATAKEKLGGNTPRDRCVLDSRNGKERLCYE